MAYLCCCLTLSKCSVCSRVCIIRTLQIRPLFLRPTLSSVVLMPRGPTTYLSRSRSRWRVSSYVWYLILYLVYGCCTFYYKYRCMFSEYQAFSCRTLDYLGYPASSHAHRYVPEKFAKSSQIPLQRSHVKLLVPSETTNTLNMEPYLLQYKRCGK